MNDSDTTPPPEGTCAFCGFTGPCPHTISRDGFGKGPKVPLCETCGGEDGPTWAEIWKKTSTLTGTDRPLAGYNLASALAAEAKENEEKDRQLAALLEQEKQGELPGTATEPPAPASNVVPFPDQETPPEPTEP